MSLVRSYYQHTHERIASRSLRWVSEGTAGIAYTKSESIGFALPPVPDQTYGQYGRPDNATEYVIASGWLYPDKLMISATGLTNWIGKGAVVEITSVTGLYYQLGFVVNQWEQGGNTYLSFYTDPNYTLQIDGAIITASLWTYSFLQEDAAMPTPNVVIHEPTLVGVEFTPPSLWEAAPRESAQVKVFRRTRPYQGTAGHIALATGQTLPCKLEPGYYAFRAATENFADHPLPSTDKTSSDACPFVITLERSRYICDFANDISQEDSYFNQPAGAWDHRQGLYISSVIDSGNSRPVYGRCYTQGGRIITTQRAGAGGLYGSPHLPYWEVLNPGGYSLITEDRFASATCYLQYGGKHYIGEQSIAHTWFNTTSRLAYCKDSNNRTASIPAGQSHDLFLEGSADVSEGDIIAFSTASIDPQPFDTYLVDSVESYYGDPAGGASPAFYTLVTVYPQLPDGGADYIGSTCYKISSTSRLGRLVRYDAGWNNLKVLHNCVVNTAIDKDGQTIARLDAGDPPGEKLTLENTDGTIRAKLQGSYYAIDAVYITSGIELKIQLRDPFGSPVTYPVPSDPGLVYLAQNCGTDQNETWLIAHPDLEGQSVTVSYSYYTDDMWIQDIWVQSYSGQTVIYAIEHGTGKMLYYDSVSDMFSSYQDLGRNQTGEFAIPTIDSNASGVWLISKPSGYLAKFSQVHTGHVDKLQLNGRAIDVLANAVQAMGMLVYLDGANKLYVKNRGGDAVSVPLPTSTIRPTPELATPIAPTSVRINYTGGSAQAGKDPIPREASISAVETYAHAAWLADYWRWLDAQDIISVDMPADETYQLGDTITVPYPNPIIADKEVLIGQIIGITIDDDAQQLHLRIRRL